MDLNVSRYRFCCCGIFFVFGGRYTKVGLGFVGLIGVEEMG